MFPGLWALALSARVVIVLQPWCVVLGTVSRLEKDGLVMELNFLAPMTCRDLVVLRFEGCT